MMLSSQENVKIQDLPHVDQVLCERYGLGIARDSDSAVHIPARLAILAVRNTNHGSTKLSAKMERKINLFISLLTTASQ